MDGSKSLLGDFFVWIVLLFVIPMSVLSLSGYFSIEMVNEKVFDSFERVCSVYEGNAIEGYSSGVRDIGGYVENISNRRLADINEERAEIYSSSLEDVACRADFLKSMVEEGTGCGDFYNRSHVFNVSRLSEEMVNGFACYDDVLVMMESSDSDISSVYMVDGEGSIVSSENIGDVKNTSLEDRLWYPESESVNGKVWSEPYKDIYSGELVTTLVVPVSLSKGQGYIGIDYSLQNQGSDIWREEGVHGFLMDSSHNLLYCPTGSDNIDGLCTRFSEACSNSEKKMINSEVDGERYFISYTGIDQGGLNLGMAVAEDEIMSPVNAVRREMERRKSYVAGVSEEIRSDIVSTLERARISVGLVAGLIGLSVIFSLYIFYGNVLRPIRIIKERADSLSRGDEVREIDVDAEGEIKELAEAFNRMLRSTKIIKRKMDREDR